jgi:regulatory protein
MDPEAAMVKARTLCARQERCRSELLARFEAWGVDGTDHAALIARLEADGFINERRYAEHFAVSKLRQNGWGRTKIRMALEEKELIEADIAAGIAVIAEEEYLITARKLATKAGPQPQAIRFLTGRGFEEDVIEEALKG